MVRFENAKTEEIEREIYTAWWKIGIERSRWRVERKGWGKRIRRGEKKVRHANAVFSGTPDAEYVYSHVKTSAMHPQFHDKSREKRAYSLCKNYPNSFHETLIPWLKTSKRAPAIPGLNCLEYSPRYLSSLTFSWNPSWNTSHKTWEQWNWIP